MKALRIVVLVVAPLTIGAQTLFRQTQQAADVKSEGCVSCHNGIEPMHASSAVKLSCTDCHGGNASVRATTLPASAEYENVKNQAHVHPRNADVWKTSANPPRTYTALLRESPEFVRFINPGDLRVAPEVCGGCHPAQVNAVPRSTMTTAAIF